MNKLKRISLLLLAFMLIAIGNPTGATAAWKRDNNGWWYTEGSSWITGWKNIDGKYYYFDSNGYMDAGCYVGEYYLNSTGAWTHLDYSVDNNKFNEFLNRLNEIEKNDSVKSKSAATTYDITMYSKEFNLQYDTLLNDIYNYLKEVMPENEFNKLQIKEMEWINKKETAMKDSLEMYKGGSICAYISGLTSLQYTHDRIYELLKYMN